ncbi:Uncharacterised protein [Mycobacteroides abscessus subsp. massiliense]|nr:Uncharacterised protein [Mycobacteroides abscessus subsp. massiliense]
MVAQERGHRAGLADHGLGDLIQLQRRHPGLGGIAHRDQRRPHDGAGSSHGVELTGRALFHRLLTAEETH